MIPKNKKAQEFAIIACGEFSYLKKDGSQFPYLGDLSEDDTISTILSKIYETGKIVGIGTGKSEKMNEIKKILDIEID